MEKKLIIAGFSGIGKTTLAKKYKNVIDLDAAEFVYDDSNILHIPFEQRKGEKRNPNINWPNNYIKAIKDAKQNYDLILVWDREDIINEYIKNDIDFILCYPSKEDLTSYIKRFRDRGNTENYIQMKLKQYDEKMIFFKSLKIEQIILTNNETLEDFLKKNNFKLIK